MEAAPPTSGGFVPATRTFVSKRPALRLPTDPSLTLPAFLLTHNPAPAHWPAFINSASGTTLSFHHFRLRIRSVAAGLYKFGVRHGDVLLLLSPNSLHFPVLVHAAILAGATITLANPLNSAHEIASQIADSRAKFVSATPSLLPKLGSNSSLPLILLPEDPENLSSDVSPPDSAQVPTIPTQWTSFANLLSSNPAHLPSIQTQQDDTAALLYSSGTTGPSKGVILTHRNLIAQCSIIFNLEGGKHRPELVYLCLLPMFHVYGMGLFTTALPALGCCVVIMPKFDIQDMLGAIERFRVTNLPLVPPILLALTKMSIVDKYDLSSLMQVGCGAAPVSKELVTAFRARFPNVTIKQGYGLTESAGITTMSITEEELERYDSVGVLAPNTEAKIVDVETRNFLSPDQQGELWVRGPTIMQGYFGNIGATDATIDQEGWLHTGDLCYFDKDGFLYVVDRLKELIKYKGLQVAPAELEAILLTHREILDAAVISLPDEEAGQIPMAYVVRSPKSTLKEVDVMTFVSEQVAPYKKVRRVVFVTTIPKSASGKILRRELMNEARSRL